MEITIKTAEEFRESYVMIQVRAADADEAAVAMTAAIREIRAPLDSPALPVPAEPTTSQA